MPRAPKKCGNPSCEERVPGGQTYCKACHDATRERSSWGRGSTRQSRRERDEVLRRWPVCYLQYPGCTQVSTEDDHVIPKGKGGSDDLANRRGACHHCHGIKSRREAAEARGAGTLPPPY